MKKRESVDAGQQQITRFFTSPKQSESHLGKDQALDSSECSSSTPSKCTTTKTSLEEWENAWESGTQGRSWKKIKLDPESTPEYGGNPAADSHGGCEQDHGPEASSVLIQKEEKDEVVPQPALEEIKGFSAESRTHGHSIGEEACQRSSHQEAAPAISSSDFVMLPCQSLRGWKQTAQRWHDICAVFEEVPQSFEELRRAILMYEDRAKRPRPLKVLDIVLNDIFCEEEHERFFSHTLPIVVSVALDLPKLFPYRLPLLVQGKNDEVRLTQLQLFCLLSNMFLCTFRRRHAQSGDFGQINFYDLFDPSPYPKHREQERINMNTHKLLCILHYFDRQAARYRKHEDLSTSVSFIRRVLTSIPQWEHSKALIAAVDLQIRPTGSIEDCVVEEKHNTKNVNASIGATKPASTSLNSPHGSFERCNLKEGGIGSSTLQADRAIKANDGIKHRQDNEGAESTEGFDACEFKPTNAIDDGSKHADSDCDAIITKSANDCLTANSASEACVVPDDAGVCSSGGGGLAIALESGTGAHPGCRPQSAADCIAPQQDITSQVHDSHATEEEGSSAATAFDLERPPDAACSGAPAPCDGSCAVTWPYWQADFANSLVGGGVLGNGCVQEEIRFAISPELIVGRLLAERLGPLETVLIVGTERFSDYTGYSSSFTFTGPYRDATPRDPYIGRRMSVVAALDALHFAHGEPALRQFDQWAVERELNKAFCAFMPLEVTPPICPPPVRGDGTAKDEHHDLTAKSEGEAAECAAEAGESGKATEHAMLEIHRVSDRRGEHEGGPDVVKGVGSSPVGEADGSSSSSAKKSVAEVGKTEMDGVEAAETEREEEAAAALNAGRIATGNWGCGVFGGEPLLKAVIQMMAAAHAGRRVDYLTFGNEELSARLEALYRRLSTRRATVGDVYRALLAFAPTAAAEGSVAGAAQALWEALMEI